MRSHLGHAAVAACCIILAACAKPERRAEAPAPTEGADPSVPFTLEHFRDERKLGEGIVTVVLDNPYGEIQVRQTSASAIAIQGVEQRIGLKPRVASIEWLEQDTHQGVRIRYPGLDPEVSSNPREGRVDLYAFVPPHVRVELRSDFGAIFVRRIANDVTARSRSGQITVAAQGAMDLESENGELRAYPVSPTQSRPMRLRSGGGILADVPLAGGAELAVTAATGIRADFELDMLNQDAGGRWQARHRVSNGGPLIAIESLGADVLLQGMRPTSN